MKHTARKLLICLCLAVLLPAAAFAESAGAPEDTGFLDRIAEWWKEEAPLFAQALRNAWTELNEPPKVIDRIEDPDAWPDFAFPGDAELLEVWFPNIRDQDATVFVYQDQVWMVDCGDERAKTDIVPLLQHVGITQIDRLFNTHPHHDHLNGIYSIDSVLPVKELLICFPEDSTKHMTAAMEYCKGNGIPVTAYEDESVFPMGDGLVSFLTWLKAGENVENINDASAQFMVSYGQCSLLIMADAERAGQRLLYDALEPEALKADILRYPHHGKKAMVDEVYDAIDPALVIVTNPCNIPEIRESTRFLRYRHVSAAYTRRGDSVLHLVTDGTRWLCEAVPFTPPPLTEEELPAEKEAEEAEAGPEDGTEENPGGAEGEARPGETETEE